MEVREFTDSERGVFSRAGQFVWERMQPLFPADIDDLLLGGQAHKIDHPDSPEAERAARRKFQLHDIIEAVRTAISAVRSSATESAMHGKEQTPRRLELEKHSAQMAERNPQIASDFTDLLMHFATVQDEVHATRETVRGPAEAVSMLIDDHSDESRRSVESTHELESERQMLFAEETGQLAGSTSSRA